MLTPQAKHNIAFVSQMQMNYLAHDSRPQGFCSVLAERSFVARPANFQEGAVIRALETTTELPLKKLESMG